MLSLIVFMAMGAEPVTAKPAPPAEPTMTNPDVPTIFKQKDETKYNLKPIQTKTGPKIRITYQSLTIEARAVRIDDGRTVTLFVATDDGKVNVTQVQKTQ
jgi:hypothetical protein